jgi:predicted Fe-Mo cluster-binding NifX family protein
MIMKITIPMNEQDLDTGVCPSFGRAPYFLFYDTNTNESRWLQNSAAESSGGAGIQAAQILADQGANALITPRCGENAEKVLRGAEISVYRSTDGTAKQNIDALTAGKLQPLAEFHAGFHGHGG